MYLHALDCIVVISNVGGVVVKLRTVSSRSPQGDQYVHIIINGGVNGEFVMG